MFIYVLTNKNLKFNSLTLSFPPRKYEKENSTIILSKENKTIENIFFKFSFLISKQGQNLHIKVKICYFRKWVGVLTQITLQTKQFSNLNSDHYHILMVLANSPYILLVSYQTPIVLWL